MQSKPRQATASSSAATRELTKLFQQATEILKERVDGLMVAFKTTEPVFSASMKPRESRYARRAGVPATWLKVEVAPVETPVAKAAWLGNPG
jgi:hypothetical protein